MKKSIVTILSIIICISVFTGCVSIQPSQTGTEPAAETPLVTTEPAELTPKPEIIADAKTISALPSAININALDDCTVPVGFEAKDICLEDGSRLVIRMTVYDSELFDLVDISMMKHGDTLFINGENVVIDTIEYDGYGMIYINGGLEEGGLWLATAENGVYYEVRENGARSYFPVGEVTIPVAQDFLFRDSSDIELGERVYYPGDLITDISVSDRVFSPNSTTATIAGGKIIALSTVFIP